MMNLNKILMLTFPFMCLTPCVFAKFGPPAPPVVIIQSVSPKPFQAYTSTLGNITAKYSVNLKTEVLGIVSRIWVQSGQDIQKNQPIIQLNHAVESAALQQAQAQYDNAAWVFRRTQKLFKKRAVSEKDLEQARQNYISTRATVAMRKAQLDQRTIKAPFPGKIGVIHVRLGDYLQPGSSVAYLGNSRVLWVDFALPQKTAQHIKPHTLLSIQSELSPQHQNIQARLTAQDPVFDPKTRQMTLRAHIIHPSKTLTAGSFATVLVPYGPTRPTISLPESAIESESGGAAVWVVSNNSVKKRSIKLGDALPNGYTAIKSGLKAGESVVILGGLKLYDGQAVVPKMASNT